MEVIRSRGQAKVPGRGAQDDPFTQNDFKRIFGKGINEFLQDSDWEDGDNEENPAAFAQVSQYDNDPQSKLKYMEKAYMKGRKVRKSVGSVEQSLNPHMI